MIIQNNFLFKRIVSNPFWGILTFLILMGLIFPPLHLKLDDGAFIICNIFPLIFGFLYGMRWGIIYALIHFFYSLALITIIGSGNDRLISNGIPSAIVTVLLMNLSPPPLLFMSPSVTV